MTDHLSRFNVTTIEEKEFTAFYNSRDLILYALSVGYGLPGDSDHGETQEEDDLKYLYEQHPEFSAVPSFCLALSFWANQNQNDATSYSIPLFPPQSMTATVIIPTRYIDSQVRKDLSDYPILHMWQSIQWHRNLPVPIISKSSIRTRLKCRILSIVPKKIGTFVTSETEIHQVKATTAQRSGGATTKECSKSLLCSLQSTALVLGIPQEIVIPAEIGSQPGMSPSSSSSTKAKPVIPFPPTKDQPADFQFTYQTTPTQSLLYRLASGDSNQIHVLGDDMLSKNLKLDDGKQQKPILHGLCTFGIATRAILKFASTTVSTTKNTRVRSTTRTSSLLPLSSSSLRKLEGRFSKPVFIGDVLVVKVWDMSSHLDQETNDDLLMVAFRVINQTTGEVAVDRGYAEVSKEDQHLKQSRPLSRL